MVCGSRRNGSQCSKRCTAARIDPTAESVYQTVALGMPYISLRTVYQTLNDLTEMGEIKRLDMGSDAARFDPNVDEHHHLVCEECGLITDAYLDVAGLDLGALDGFEPTRTKVVVMGRCERCAAGGADRFQQTTTHARSIMSNEDTGAIVTTDEGRHRPRSARC